MNKFNPFFIDGEYLLVFQDIKYLLDYEDEMKEWLKSDTKTGRIEGIVVVFDVPEERTMFLLRWS